MKMLSILIIYVLYYMETNLVLFFWQYKICEKTGQIWSLNGTGPFIFLNLNILLQESKFWGVQCNPLLVFNVFFRVQFYTGFCILVCQLLIAPNQRCHIVPCWKSVLPHPRMSNASPVNARDLSCHTNVIQPGWEISSGILNCEVMHLQNK